MKYIGAHVSTTGGVFNAPLNAKKIGATAFALFTRNQRQWKSKPLTDDEIAKFKEYCEKENYRADYILPHDTYLVNLGAPEKDMLEKSREAFIDDLKRCRQLGLKYLNFHRADMAFMPRYRCGGTWPETVSIRDGHGVQALSQVAGELPAQVLLQPFLRQLVSDLRQDAFQVGDGAALGVGVARAAPGDLGLPGLQPGTLQHYAA